MGTGIGCTPLCKRQTCHLPRGPWRACHPQEYQADNDVFLQEFAAAWYKLMNADRFKGPDANACDQEPPAK